MYLPWKCIFEVSKACNHIFYSATRTSIKDTRTTHIWWAHWNKFYQEILTEKISKWLPKTAIQIFWSATPIALYWNMKLSLWEISITRKQQKWSTSNMKKLSLKMKRLNSIKKRNSMKNCHPEHWIQLTITPKKVLIHLSQVQHFPGRRPNNNHRHLWISVLHQPEPIKPSQLTQTFS